MTPVKTAGKSIQVIFLVCILGCLLTLAEGAEQKTNDFFKNIGWRHIGPTTFGGRIPDIEAVPGNPMVVYVAASTGGIFKSTNAGVTWTPVFDEAGDSVSIGDMALAPADPDLIWVGTGEGNCDQNAGTIGDGVYKSLDGGKTWQNMGLKDSHHIGRVLIHPRDPETVYVAAAGHLWGPNRERGLFRTTDGGKTWENVLFINEDTGVTDVAMEPNGRILYAVAFQRRRTAWGVAQGGPHSGIYRSLDGGDTWVQLKKGLPSGDLEKMGVTVSPSNPEIAYAIIGHKDGGVFRTSDRGETWTRVNKIRSPGYWYGQIYVDPVNPDKIWVPGVQLAVSIDGGKNFETDWTARNIHVDHHALWINPDNTDHQYLGNDGGFYVTWDGGRNWDFRNNLPIAQYYAIGIDNRKPYWIYGGLQDNGTWGIPSMNYDPRGITNADTICVAYGDGFYAAIDPTDPMTLYAESQFGVLQRVSLNPRELKMIQPVPENSEEKYRFTWNSPILISPHDPKRLYFGGNKLFTTNDGGQSWTEVSPDLTRNLDKKDAEIMGVKASLRAFSTITTISESKLRAGLIYVGTDDGLVHITRDGGADWENLTEKLGVPETLFATRVLASSHAEGTAYVTFSGHYEGDYRPYLYKTDDFGQTWRNIGAGMPPKSVVKCVLEHPRNPELLLAGVHYGLLISLDGGGQWVRAGGNLPAVAVDDMIIEPEENDLILGTYGRGIIIMDDISMLEESDASRLGQDSILFSSRPVIQYIYDSPLPDQGEQHYWGPNPAYGLPVTYYLKEDLKSPAKTGDTKKKADEKIAPVKFAILDGNGEIVRELEGPGAAGFHRITWDLRYEHPLAKERSRRPYEGPFALPGTYTLKMTAGSIEQTTAVDVLPDPDSKASSTDLEARLEASRQVMGLQQLSFQGRQLLTELEKEFKQVQQNIMDKKDVPEAVTQAVKKFDEALKQLKNDFSGGGGWVEAGLLGQLQSSTSAPSQSDHRRIRNLKAKTSANITRLNEMVSTDLAELRKVLLENGLAFKMFKTIEMPEK